MDIRKWLKNNLISAFQSGIFAKEQIAIFSMNHLAKGNLTEADVAEIARVMEPQEEPIE